MNILYLINHPGQGGTEKYVRIMASHTQRQGGRVFFIHNESGPLVTHMEQLGATTQQLTMHSPPDIPAARKLAQYCKTNAINIIHTQFARENYIALFARRFFGCGAAVVHTCHITARNPWGWRMMHRLFSGGNAQVIAVCNAVRDLLVANGYKQNRIKVIFNGVHYRDTLPPPTAHDPFHFISLTRFTEEKGVFFLLETAAQMPGNFHLTIAGDGPLLPLARQFVTERNLQHCISLPGYINDAAAFLAEGDCYINSSSREAHSFAILEAMEAGLPIIATDVGGNPDIINGRTSCGIRISYGDTAALTQAMLHIQNNTAAAATMSANARLAVKDLFNIEETIRATYAVYQSVL
jgi:glycosyltransferase involved in cell wall biosynthesis